MVVYSFIDAATSQWSLQALLSNSRPMSNNPSNDQQAVVGAKKLIV
jgi:hypothetical protein